MAGGWTDGQTDRSPAEPSRAPGSATIPRPRVPAGGRGEGKREDALAGAYLGALAQQRLDESPADALRPAGDQSHLAIDVHGRRAPAARSAPAEPQQSHAVSPARFPLSLLRALPRALPPSLLLPLPPLQRLIPHPLPARVTESLPELPGRGEAGAERVIKSFSRVSA